MGIDLVSRKGKWQLSNSRKDFVGPQATLEAGGLAGERLPLGAGHRTAREGEG